MSDRNNYGDEQQIIHGGDEGNKPTSEVPVAGASKAAPLPEGLKDEVKDEGFMSGGGSRGNLVGSGKGGHEPHSMAGDKGLGNYMGGTEDDPTFLEKKQSNKQGKNEDKEEKE